MMIAGRLPLEAKTTFLGFPCRESVWLSFRQYELVPGHRSKTSAQRVNVTGASWLLLVACCT
eukprot:6326772-Pyramimonas_sp.AAC.1